MASPFILVINPGNTSTKVGVFAGTSPLFIESIRHSDQELSQFADINAQKDFREKLICELLEKRQLALRDCQAIACRGGLLKPLASGTYEVSESMIRDLLEARRGIHASNLAAQIGYSIAAKNKIPCYIVDPVSVDECQPIARYSGHKLFQRIMLTHALNMKAVAKRFAKEKKKEYQKITLIVIHMGTGVSLSLHQNGKMIDAVNPSEEGPFSMDRSGGLPILQLARHIIENRLDYRRLEKMVFGEGGVYSYLGTKDFTKVKEKVEKGDPLATEIVQAMAYQIAKDAGGLSTVVNGKVDAILITGGMAFNDFFNEMIRKRIEFIAPIFIYPGEDEIQALAEGVFRVLAGEEKALKYPD